MTTCARPDCAGSIDEDGYCDTCGHAAAPPDVSGPRPPPEAQWGTPTVAPVADVAYAIPAARTTGTAPTHARGRLGAGLVSVPAVPRVDPSSALLTDPEVPEEQRFCGRCHHPVGRTRNGRPGRLAGYCPQDGARYSFVPTLEPGVLVGGQYEVRGCLAHGGLGWIYLAIDRNVSNRWVVLKGLLNAADPEAARAALAERQFLAQVNHHNIVKIYNFVQHPDADGSPVGYIVMEYVGGSSLRELLLAGGRRPDGAFNPLPVRQAIAYGLEILLALGHVHEQDMVYCDLKPDNVIQYDRYLKLIDLGAMRRIDDRESPIYGSVGYQAPEVGQRLPSPGSDLYTVGRTLAVLALGARLARGRTALPLPGRDEHPVLARHESFDRLLRRATDADPDRRFGSADEMADQLDGVLREVLATEDGCPHPVPSAVFGPPRGVFAPGLLAGPAGPGRPDPRRVAAALPVPQVDPSDPSAGLLATAAAATREEVARIVAAEPAPGPELRLRLVRAHLDAGEPGRAIEGLDALAAGGVDDRRVRWYRGLAALASGAADVAVEVFDRMYGELPGEPAPKLALAAAADCAGRDEVAARYYALVATTDPNTADATFGAARGRLRAQDRAGAVAVLAATPETSSRFVTAQLAAVEATMLGRTARQVGEDELRAAAARVQGLPLDPTTELEVQVVLLDAAVELVAPNGAGPLFLGCEWREHDLRLALERCLRRAARLTRDVRERVALVDRANAVRPATWT